MQSADLFRNGSLDVPDESIPVASDSSAILSECSLYRYRLDRRVGAGERRLVVIMVNPSTADHIVDDHTIRKVNGFCTRLGYSLFTVGNLFAWRAKDVKELGKVADPVGILNDVHLDAMMEGANGLLFAWGPAAKLPRRLRTRWERVDTITRRSGLTPHCLGVAQDGHPRHPLTLGYKTPMVPWQRPT